MRATAAHGRSGSPQAVRTPSGPAPADCAPPGADASEPSRSATFASLRVRNFRLFATGQVFSNTGSWVQRIAQDWLVLTLTGSATAVGVTTALQFLPTLLFGLIGGAIADRYPKRSILLGTQFGFSAMAALLAVLTLTGRVQAWHVYAIAFGLGLVTALDNPCRQSFVNEMVGPGHLRNAISINSSVWQLAALIGPAISGALISAVGAGYSFAVNAVSYAPAFVALLRMRTDELGAAPSPGRTGGGRLADGVRYVLRRPHMLWPTVLVGVVGMFSSNLAVTLAAYARSVFHAGAGGYGMLSSAVAVGSLAGALTSARRAGRTRLRGLAAIGLVLGSLEVVAALAPTEWAYCLLLAAVGAATLLFITSANSMVQLAAHDGIRGRVMGVYLLVFVGSGALGGPLVGAVDQHLGPHAGMLLAGALPGTVIAAVAVWLAHRGRLRLRLQPHGPLRHLVAVVPR